MLLCFIITQCRYIVKSYFSRVKKVPLDNNPNGIHPKSGKYSIIPMSHSLTKKRETVRKPSKLGESNPLTGLLFCADCGQPMVVKTAKKKEKRYVYFVCSTHKKYGTCKNNNISDKAIEKSVLLSTRQQVTSLLSAKSVTNDLGTNTLQSRQQLAIESRIENNLNVIRENQNYLVKSCEQFIDGFISETEYTMFKATFNKQIETAENAITSLQEQLRKLTDLSHSKNLIEKFREYGEKE